MDWFLHDIGLRGERVKGNISVYSTAAAPPAANNRNKKVIFKNCAPFTDCISKINNTQVDNAKDIDIVMPMYNLIEYSDNYSKTSGSLWQYCKDVPTVNNNGNIVDFKGVSATDSINFKTKITGQRNNYGIINMEKIVPLTLFRMEEPKRPPYQFLPCNFYKRCN